jgi:hypothetical protein
VPTVNELRVRRLKTFRQLKREVRGLESATQDLKRLVEKVLDRRLNIPEEKDIVEAAGLAEGCANNTKDVVDQITRMENLMRIGQL